MKNYYSTGGCNFCALLTILFVACKLTGIVRWSWLWVLSPLWINWTVVIAIVIFFRFSIVKIHALEPFVRILSFITAALRRCFLCPPGPHEAGAGNFYTQIRPAGRNTARPVGATP